MTNSLLLGLVRTSVHCCAFWNILCQVLQRYNKTFTLCLSVTFYRSSVILVEDVQLYLIFQIARHLPMSPCCHSVTFILYKLIITLARCRRWPFKLNCYYYTVHPPILQYIIGPFLTFCSTTIGLLFDVCFHTIKENVQSSNHF